MRSLTRPGVSAVAAVALLAGLATPAGAAEWPSTSPTGLAQSAATSTSLSVTWKPVAKAERYRLQISASSSMSDATYQRSTDTAETVNGLQPGRGYYVKVRVITADGVNRSAYSDAVRVWTSFPAPTGLTATERDSTSLTFDWAGVTNAPRYRILIADNASLASATTIASRSPAARSRG